MNENKDVLLNEKGNTRRTVFLFLLAHDIKGSANNPLPCFISNRIQKLSHKKALVEKSMQDKSVQINILRERCRALKNIGVRVPIQLAMDYDNLFSYVTSFEHYDTCSREKYGNGNKSPIERFLSKKSFFNAYAPEQLDLFFYQRQLDSLKLRISRNLREVRIIDYKIALLNKLL